MKVEESCPVRSGCWNFHEVVGIVFIALAAILTLITLNGFGIAAMFIVGGWLCGHKWGKCGCSCHSHCDIDDLDVPNGEVKVVSKRTTTKKIAK